MDGIHHTKELKPVVIRVRRHDVPDAVFQGKDRVLDIDERPQD